MGEWSKTVGERGEEIVSLLLDRLGWTPSKSGVKVVCTDPKHFNKNGNEKETHGIDFVYSYQSPLSDDLFDTLAISSKFSSSEYPSALSATFRDYYKDIAQAISCFRKSTEYSDHVSLFRGRGEKRVIGVIFWLNNGSPDAQCKEELTKIDILQSQDKYDAIYVVDNRSASFLYDAIGYVKAAYSAAEVKFCYVESGKYLNSVTREFNGNVLPIEYLNLGILPFKLTKDKISTLILCCTAPFNGSELGRLIGLSQSISQDWAAHIKILFRDYNPLLHSNVVAEVSGAFQVKKVIDKLEVGSFDPNFINASS
jgi:hypothetical protein